MRRALLVLAPLLGWPAGATAVPGPTLTLKAPRATSYLHRIEFVGRITPATPDARVHLLRGTTHVAFARVRPLLVIFSALYLLSLIGVLVAYLIARSIF